MSLIITDAGHRGALALGAAIGHHGLHGNMLVLYMDQLKGLCCLPSSD